MVIGYTLNMLTANEQHYLESLWTDTNHPASYTGPFKLYQFVKKEGKFKIGLRRIRQFLSNQDAYSLQKRVQRKFKRRSVVVAGIDSLWDADLMSVQNISKYNDGIQYILVLQDIFSRFIFTYPLKQKTGLQVKSGLKTVFATGRRPKVLRSDKGTDFLNRWVQAFLKKENVHHILSQNEKKASYAERAISILKNRMYRMFTQTNSYEYLTRLQDITKNINDTPSRPLKEMAPSQVNKENEEEVRLNQYLVRTKTKLKTDRKLPETIKKQRKKKTKKPFYKLRVNDHVRITHLSRPFQREYDQKWSGEIFKISDRFKRENLPLYKLKDFDDESITGSFYEQELQKSDKNQNTAWKIDKILKTRKTKGQTMVLVSWLHWPSKFNSWIPQHEIKDI